MPHCAVGRPDVGGSAASLMSAVVARASPLCVSRSAPRRAPKARSHRALPHRIDTEIEPRRAQRRIGVRRRKARPVDRARAFGVRCLVGFLVAFARRGEHRIGGLHVRRLRREIDGAIIARACERIAAGVRRGRGSPTEPALGGSAAATAACGACARGGVGFLLVRERGPCAGGLSRARPRPDGRAEPIALERRAAIVLGSDAVIALAGAVDHRTGIRSERNRSRRRVDVGASSR